MVEAYEATELAKQAEEDKKGKWRHNRETDNFLRWVGMITATVYCSSPQ